MRINFNMEREKKIHLSADEIISAASSGALVGAGIALPNAETLLIASGITASYGVGAVIARNIKEKITEIKSDEKI